MLAAAWGGNHYSPLLLLYRQVDGYSQVEVDLFFAFYILGLTPGFLLAGPLADRYGRKKPVLAALLLGIAGSAVLALGSSSVFWMCAGRLICGVSVAVAMVAGTSWIKELSQHDATPPVRARRAALTLTAGFGLGAGVSGALAQWGPHPTLLPYLVQIGLSLASIPLLLATPETGSPSRRPLFGDLRVPAAGRRRFRLLVLPMAPWVFAAPALAFVIAPTLVADRTAGHRIAFAALLAVLTLVTGAAVQPFAGRLPRPATLGLVVIAAGTAILAVHPGVLTAVVTALLFGLGYGTCIVSGLVEIQAMADPESLAGLTGIYYSLTYIGFVLPVLLAALAHVTTYPVLLGAVAALCLACAAVTARAR